jgi:plasmid stability protein
MATVTVRHLEDAVVEALKERARANNRSLEGELRQILTDAARPLDVAELPARAEPVAAMSSAAGQTDSVAPLRQERRR